VDIPTQARIGLEWATLVITAPRDPDHIFQCANPAIYEFAPWGALIKISAQNRSGRRMKNRRPKIIKDNKRRGEWAESVFMARAAENGLPVSKPLGDSDSFDCVVGRSGKFVAVQVKCTMAKREGRKGYSCAVKSGNKGYAAGAFDFVAAYVIPEDTWYIIPEKRIRRQWWVCLCSADGNFEQYREAWHLLREATQSEDAAEESATEPLDATDSPVLALMQRAANFFRNCLENGGRVK
jgi:hypothetical protein